MYGLLEGKCSVSGWVGRATRRRPAIRASRATVGVSSGNRRARTHVGHVQIFFSTTGGSGGNGVDELAWTRVFENEA